MKRFESLLLSIALVLIVGVFFNLGLLFMSFLNNSTFSIIYLFLFVIIFIISFIIIPISLINRIQGIKIKFIMQNVFNWKRTIILFPIILLLSFVLVGKDATTEYFIVAFGEEFLFRHLILIILMHSFSKNWSIIIGSLLFAIILHLNGNFLINLLTKFPFSILLYYLSNKYKLQDAIAFHWLYNILVYRFI